VLIEPRAAGNDLGRKLRVTNLETRQRWSRGAGKAEESRRAIGTADVGIGPARRRLAYLADLELIAERKRHLAAAIGHAV